MFSAQLQKILDNLSTNNKETLYNDVQTLPNNLSLDNYQVSLIFFRLTQMQLGTEMLMFLTHIESGITRDHMVSLFTTFNSPPPHNDNATTTTTTTTTTLQRQRLPLKRNLLSSSTINFNVPNNTNVIAAAATSSSPANTINIIKKNNKKQRITSPGYKTAFVEYVREWFTSQPENADPSRCVTLTMVKDMYEKWFEKRGAQWMPKLGSIPGSISRVTARNAMRELEIPEFPTIPGRERRFRLIVKNVDNTASTSDDELEEEEEEEEENSVNYDEELDYISGDIYDEEDSFLVDNDRVDYATDASVNDEIHQELTSTPIFNKNNKKSVKKGKNPFIDCEASDTE